METIWLEKRRYGEPRVAILFPNIYKIGISNLAVHTLYRLVNRRALADLFFTDMERGIKTGWRLGEFDLILLTLPYEFDLLPLLRKLAEWGIDVEKEKRKVPIIAGGIFPSANPTVLSPIFDVVAVGEAEVIIPAILDSFTKDKNIFIKKLSEFEWAYIEDLKEEARRVLDWPHERADSYSVLLDKRAAFKDMFLIEVGRGCPNKCRFCLLSYLTLPPRFSKLNKFIQFIDNLKFEISLGLVGSAILEHPELEDFLDKLPANVKRVSLSSMRIELTTRELLYKLKKLGLKTITVAPEAGSIKLRKKINKPIPEEEILRMVEDANAAGIRKMKLYFMIGLPGEEREDIEAITTLLNELKSKFKGNMSATVSIFVPKPATPFEDTPFIEVDEFKEKVAILRTIKRIGIRIHGYRESEWQAIISRGDEKLGRAFVEAVLHGIPLGRAMKRMGVDKEKYLRDQSYFLKAPYKRIDTLVERKFLTLEVRKSMDGRITPPCNVGRCNICGVCGKVFHLETEGYKIG